MMPRGVERQLRNIRVLAFRIPCTTGCSFSGWYSVSSMYMWVPVWPRTLSGLFPVKKNLMCEDPFPTTISLSYADSRPPPSSGFDEVRAFLLAVVFRQNSFLMSDFRRKLEMMSSMRFMSFFSGTRTRMTAFFAWYAVWSISRHM